MNVFASVDEQQWRAPSQVSPHRDRTWFHITARLHDGHPIWRGEFESRDDFDAFSWALIRHEVERMPVPRSMWDMPTPSWDPGLDDYEPAYIYATSTLITGSPGSEAGRTLPTDWNPGNNNFDAIGAGGSGACCRASNTKASGGSGAAWKRLLNFSQLAGSSITVRIGLGGTGVTTNATAGIQGNDGTSTYLKNSGATIVLEAFPGQGGAATTTRLTTIATNPGASGASGAGSSGNSGGDAGSCLSTGFSAQNGTGGGGAGGESGVGGSSASSVTGIKTTGGAGNGTNSGDGSDAKGNAGSGAANTTSDGGIYGAGSGASIDSGTWPTTTGDGAQGCLTQTYTPAFAVAFLPYLSLNPAIMAR